MSMAKTVAGKNINPLSDFILIKPISQEETLPSGIVLPDTAKEKPQIGEVMAVGPGKVNDQGKVMPISV
jgi:chaperonin GroES